MSLRSLVLVLFCVLASGCRIDVSPLPGSGSDSTGNPLDSLLAPSDTLVLRDTLVVRDTIREQLPPRIDTVHVTDTLIVRDTVFQTRWDTIRTTDTVHVPQVDTVTVTDTIYVPRVDTVYLPPEEEPPATTEAVTLPLRVMEPLGEETEARTVTISDAQGIDRLWMQVHSPAFQDQLVNPDRGAKMSVRLNGGEWIDATNQNAKVYGPASKHHGIGGGHHTVRFSVPVSGVEQGSNTVEFRFNGTDGISSGFRVLAFNFLRGEDESAKVLPASAFEQDDPSQWQAPEGYRTAAAVGEGERLWYEARLVESLKEGVDVEVLRASCSSCHVKSGRDLKYFAFSNESIVTRSQFHGLSEQEGKRVAAYIRSIELTGDNGETYAAPGRPWNPPYQPAPGMDEKPPHEWAAGGGLDAVLEDDHEMWAFMKQGGSLKDAFAVSASSSDDMKLYNQPVEVQFPDWNQWLAQHHPLDIYGDWLINTTSEAGQGETWRDDILALQDRMIRELDKWGAGGLAATNEMQQFGGGARRNFFKNLDSDAVAKAGYEEEDRESSVKKWALTKLWQEQHRRGFADDADVIYGEDGAARSWLDGRSRVAFDLGPHLSADTPNNYDWQLPDVGNYKTTAWYHLQFVLNAGNQNTGAISPVDWNYHPKFIQYTTGHAARFTQSFAAMFQQFFDDDRTTGDIYIRQIHPGLFGPDGKYSEPLDAAPPEERRMAYNALLPALMDILESRSPGEWREAWGRPDGSAQAVLRGSSYTPEEIDTVMRKALHGKDFQWADGFYTVIPRFAEAGVDRAVLDRMVAWGETMWPNGDWQSLDLSGAQ